MKPFPYETKGNEMVCITPPLFFKAHPSQRLSLGYQTKLEFNQNE